MADFLTIVIVFGIFVGIPLAVLQIARSITYRRMDKKHESGEIN